MLKFDAGKLAKDAAKGLQQLEKQSGEAGEVVKNVLDGVKKAEKLANASGKVPEPVLALLRKLLSEAEELARTSESKNAALEACIQKVRAMLEGGDLTAETVAELTDELRGLMKGGAAQPAKTENAGAGRRAPAAPAPKAAKPAVQFSDVKPDAYYYDAVQWAVQEGVASGTSESTFGPEQTCTRAQTISFLWRAEGSPVPADKGNPFTDVADGAYYRDAALWAAERGIVAGTEFQPDSAVTRGQLSAFLYRNAGSPAVKGSVSFADVPEDAYFAQAVAWVAEQGITSGTGENTFSPDTVCTRGQIVTFLYRAKK